MFGKATSWFSLTLGGVMMVWWVLSEFGGTDRISCLASLGAPLRDFIAAFCAVLMGGRYSLTG